MILNKNSMFLITLCLLLSISSFSFAMENEEDNKNIEFRIKNKINNKINKYKEKIRKYEEKIEEVRYLEILFEKKEEKKGNSQYLPHKGQSNITISNKLLVSKEDENLFKKAFPFQSLPTDLQIHILKYAVTDFLDDGAIGKLSVVCKKWHSIIKQRKIEFFKFAICQIFSVDPETCEKFLNGKLIYKPNEDNDIGKVEMRIADLANPLVGTFDLSQCGDTGQYLSISTGYRKEKKAENANKVEIWVAPRFLIEKELQSTAVHFKDIFPAKWPGTAPVGTIWTSGEWDNLTLMDYLTTQNMDEFSNENLYNKWREHGIVSVWTRGGHWCETNFTFIF